jgi:hypothetical protein
MSKLRRVLVQNYTYIITPSSSHYPLKVQIPAVLKGKKFCLLPHNLSFLGQDVKECQCRLSSVNESPPIPHPPSFQCRLFALMESLSH